MNSQSISPTPDAAQQEPETARVSPSAPNGWGKVPHSLARDNRLTPLARLLWVILEGRQGSRSRVRVGQAVLAQDLGVTPRTAQRALAELVAAGLVTVKRTGKTSIYVVHNPARDTTQMTAQDSQKRQERRIRYDTDDVSTEQETLRKKKASKQVRESVTEGLELAPAAASVAQEIALALPSPDPLTREAFLSALPSHLRPADTARVASLIATALARGWTATGLAQAVGKEVPNPNAGPGMAVTALAALSQQPPSEHSERPKPVRFDPVNECHHGFLKVYGCEHCVEERAATQARGRVSA